MSNYTQYNTIEQFILDDDFLRLSERNNADEIAGLLSLYPEKKDIIKEAFVLLRHVRITIPEIPDSQVEKDLSDLLAIIEERETDKKRKIRKRRLLLWSGVASIAACLIIFFTVFGSIFKPDVNEKDHLFSLIQSADINTDEIRIISGENQTNVDNEEVITQTEDGNIVVGDEQTIESAMIQSEYVTVVVPKGRRTTVRFSDGSTAWVNSGSKLVYPKLFSNKTREIIVDGEVYLDVRKSDDQPFVVHTQKFEVQVLGTKFNVNAYNDDSNQSVVLVDGSVEIKTETSKGKLIPNQGYFSEEGKSKIKNVDVYPYICWIEGVLKLENEPLNLIMKRLSRHYGVNIQISERIADEKYNGKLDLKEPIETVLYNISMSTSMTYSRQGDAIDIK